LWARSFYEGVMKDLQGTEDQGAPARA